MILSFCSTATRTETRKQRRSSTRTEAGAAGYPSRCSSAGCRTPSYRPAGRASRTRRSSAASRTRQSTGSWSTSPSAPRATGSSWRSVRSRSRPETMLSSRQVLLIYPLCFVFFFPCNLPVQFISDVHFPTSTALPNIHSN